MEGKEWLQECSEFREFASTYANFSGAKQKKAATVKAGRFGWVENCFVALDNRVGGVEKNVVPEEYVCNRDPNSKCTRAYTLKVMVPVVTCFRRVLTAEEETGGVKYALERGRREFRPVVKYEKRRADVYEGVVQGYNRVLDQNTNNEVPICRVIYADVPFGLHQELTTTIDKPWEAEDVSSIQTYVCVDQLIFTYS